ncbi:MAG: ribonuclease P protein component [Gammaproteobacteria bacterium]|nr:ribonuclease P protein component [Gammaproteobacteria bacterium]
MAASSLGFPKRARLLTRRDFDRVFARAKRSSDEGLVLLARPNGCDGARLGLAIARKHVRHAVERNRIKRLVRESFRHHRSQLGPLDVVVLARRGLAEWDNARVTAALARHWKRLHESCEASSCC